MKMIISKKHRQTLLTYVIGFSLIAIINLTFDITPVASGGSTYYVGGIGAGNYTKIQWAIENATVGDTVFVYAGAYNEKVILNKTINLTGEGRDVTIINNSGLGGDTVKITANYVNISGFTITNGRSYWDSGICAVNVNGSRIYNNNVSNNGYGIYLGNSNLSIISGNLLSQNIYRAIYLDYSNKNEIWDNSVFHNADGIRLIDSKTNNIAGNNVSWSDKNGVWISSDSDNNQVIDNNIFFNGGWGIHIGFSHSNNVTNNTCNSNFYDGISISRSSNCIVIGNNVSKNENGIDVSTSNGNIVRDNTAFSIENYGINLRSSTYNTVTGNIMGEKGLHVYGELLTNWNSHTIDDSNTINGKKVYYWKNQTGGIIPPDAGQVILANSSYIKVENLSLINGSGGVHLGFSSNNTIINNNVSSHRGIGIYLYRSNGNDIINNNASFNHDASGIRLDFSDNNNITGNIASSNERHNAFGIRIHHSDGNTITGNNAHANTWYGIGLYYSEDNEIIDNVAMDNREGIHLEQSDLNTIVNNNVSGNRDGIALRTYSNKNNINANNASFNECGFAISSSRETNIIDNIATFNSDYGLSISQSNNCNITSNYISSNEYGIRIYETSYNNITDNTIISNSLYGIFMVDAIDNITFHHNNFIDNTEQVNMADANYKDIFWDDGMGEGNYWSDYNGIDDGSNGRIAGDGIGDIEIPHPFTDQGNGYYRLDNYPLMWPLGLDRPLVPPRVYHLKVNGFLALTPEIQHIIGDNPIFSFTYYDFNTDYLNQYNVSVWDDSGSNLIWECNMSGSASSGSDIVVIYNTAPCPTNGPTLEVGTTYKLRVVAKNSTGSWSKASELDFHMNEVLIPIPDSPFDNSLIDASSNQTVSWASPGLDSDGDYPVSYTWEVATDAGFANIIESGSGNVTESSPFDTSSSSEFFWRVSLSDGWETSSYGNQPDGFWNFTSYVRPINNPPTITNGASSPAVASVDNPLSFMFIAYDPDTDDLSWSKISGPDWLNIGSANGMIYGTPSNEDVGYNEFMIQVSDPEGDTDNYTFAIEVVNGTIINNPPAITNKESVPIIAFVNSTLSFTFEATDTDNDTLVWSKITGPNWLQIDQNNGNIFGTPSLDDIGYNVFMIEVTDRRGGTDSCIFNITVEESIENKKQDSDENDSSILWLLLVIAFVAVVLVLFLIIGRKKSKDEIDLPKRPSVDYGTSSEQNGELTTGPMDPQITPEKEPPQPSDEEQIPPRE
jgi:parallel beta-helix repeat protein